MTYGHLSRNLQAELLLLYQNERSDTRHGSVVRPTIPNNGSSTIAERKSGAALIALLQIAQLPILNITQHGAGSPNSPAAESGNCCCRDSNAAEFEVGTRPDPLQRKGAPCASLLEAFDDYDRS